MTNKNGSVEFALIQRWVDLVDERRDVIGKTPQSATGEEFTTSGDIELDNRVARILLDAVQNRLPTYGIYNSESDEVVTSRTATGIKERKVQLLPALLFSIDWVASAPGVNWPEAYFVTYVPTLDIRIVTASRDGSSIWGFEDLAIGYCRAIRTPEFGTKKIIQSWWHRASGAGMIAWEEFLVKGLVDERRAENWRREVFGSVRQDDW